MNSPVSTQPNHRLLVIDDNRAIHDDMRKILIGDRAEQLTLERDEQLLFDATPAPASHFEIDSAYQGQEGLSLLEQSIAEGRPYSVAFVDVRMPPGWDGVETIERLWQADPELQAVICTAHSDYSWTDIHRRLGQSGNLLILKKPFDNIEVTQLAYALTKKWLVSRQASARMGDLDRMVASRTEELQKAEEAFRVVFEVSPIGIATSDMDCRYLDVNSACEEMFGLTKDQIIGKNPLELGWLHNLADLKELSRKLSDFGYVNAEEVTSANPASGTRTGLLWLREVTIHGSPHVLWFHLDITELRQQQDLLKRRAEELTRSNAELEQFAYVASHDLQEPLRMVASYTQLLSRRYAGSLDQKADQYIGFAVDGAKRMQTLIHDLLALSSVGGRGGHFGPTDLNEVLEEVLQNLQPAIHDSCAVVSSDPLPTLMADRGQMAQLMQNLIGNAIKFHGASNPRVHAFAVETEREWTISVRDNGIGIEAAYADRIFRIFQRLHGRERYPGSGIGLAICRKILERHGGRIWLDSSAGSGSTFRFAIPKLIKECA